MKITKISLSILLATIFFVFGCSQKTQESVSNTEKPISQASVGSSDAQNYRLDLSASTFGWHAEKVIGAHDGFININRGEFSVKDGKIESGRFSIDMNSITNTDLTGSFNEMLVNDLKSSNFFDSEKFPISTFEITKTEQSTDGSTKITGNLTIKDIKREIEFNTQITFTENTATATAEFQIDRTLWDIRYRSGSFFENIGDKAVDDLFTVKLNLTAQKI